MLTLAAEPMNTFIGPDHAVDGVVLTFPIQNVPDCLLGPFPIVWVQTRKKLFVRGIRCAVGQPKKRLASRIPRNFVGGEVP